MWVSVTLLYLSLIESLLKDNFKKEGQWLCGSVGRAVDSDTRGPRFKSSQSCKFIYIEHLFTVNCVLKRRNKEKEAGNGPFKKKLSERTLCGVKIHI